MEVLNCNERQGKSIGEIESSYKMIGLSVVFMMAMVVYASFVKTPKNIESKLEQRAETQLVQNH